MRLETEKQADGRGIELSQKGVNEAVARGLSVVQGDADHDLATYPDARLRLRHPEPDAAGDLQSAHRARAAPAHRPEGRRLLPEFRQLARPQPVPPEGPHADHRGPALQLVRHAEHPLLHGARFRDARARRSTRRSRRRWRSTATTGAQPLGPPAAVEFPRRPGDLPALTARDPDLLPAGEGRCARRAGGGRAPGGAPARAAGAP